MGTRWASDTEGKESLKNTSPLDLAAPTSPVTLEKPLLLQECESDPSESKASMPLEYTIGDLCWAAISGFPYWPAIVAKDPITDVAYKSYVRKTMWHVYFLGDAGQRGWVSNKNTFVFDGLNSYNDAKLQFFASNAKLLTRKVVRNPFSIQDKYERSWNAAVMEAKTLLSADRSVRLEFIIEMLEKRTQQLKMKRSRSLSLQDLDLIVPRKRARKSEPLQNSSGNIASSFARIKGLITPAVEPPTESNRMNLSLKEESLKETNTIDFKAVPNELSTETSFLQVGGELPGVEIMKRKRGRPRKSPLPSPNSLLCQFKLKPVRKVKGARLSLPVSLSKDASLDRRRQVKGRGKTSDVKENGVTITRTGRKSISTINLPTPSKGRREKGEENLPKIKDEAILSSSDHRKSPGKHLSKNNDKKSETQSECEDEKLLNGDSELEESPQKIKLPLFAGTKDIKVCSICLQGRQVVRCCGPCNLFLHVECSDKPRFVSEPRETPRGAPGKKRKEGGRLSNQSNQKIKISNEEIYSVNGVNSESDESVLVSGISSSLGPGPSTIPTPPPEDVDKSQIETSTFLCEHDVSRDTEMCFQRDSAESTTSETSFKEKNSDDKKEGKEKRWMCQMCIDSILGPCFICGKDDGNRMRCKIANCGKVYHLGCVRDWPQHVLREAASGKLKFSCPAHACHTCISDNPALLSTCVQNRKLVRCLRCPTSYHHGDHCVPAGSLILSSTQMICPSHLENTRKSLGLTNLRYCNLCRNGGSLICCDLCPFSAHVECLEIPIPDGSYKCLECQTGRFPLFGEIVWAKLGIYRWWPARIIFPCEIPSSLRRLENEHLPGEFVVKFYGTNNYVWLHRGRVFPFDEPDFEKMDTSLAPKKRRSEHTYNVGIQEAIRDFILWNEQRHQLKESQRTTKVPKYVRITTNKPVGSVKLNENTEPDACECTLEMKDPCGPTSSCLNRAISVECSPTNCPVGSKCRNQNFEKKLSPPLTLFQTDSTGWGVKTDVPLKKGNFIIEYVGEMIDAEEFRKRLGRIVESKSEGFYFLTLEKDIMLDAGPKGNLSRFLNHSCQPNCKVEKWTVLGKTRIGIFAMQDIPVGTELVFDYNFTIIGEGGIVCKCRAPNCRGFIGPKPFGTKQLIKQVAPQPKRLPIKLKKKSTRRSKSLVKVALVNSRTGLLDNSIAAVEDNVKCFVCQEHGATIICADSSCKKTFHLACMGLNKEPPRRWTCPSHECSICRSRNKVEHCSVCINSYCNDHQDGYLVLNIGGSYCHNHNLTDSGSEWSSGGTDERANSPKNHFAPLLEGPPTDGVQLVSC